MYNDVLVEACKQIVEENTIKHLTHHELAKEIKDQVYKETISFPSKINYSQRILAISQQKDCVCEVCGKVHGHYLKRYCSKPCHHAAQKANALTKEEKRNQSLINQIKNSEKQYAGKIEGYDYLVCQICGLKGADLNRHIIKSHNMTTKEYKETYNVECLKSQRLRDNVKGENNPGYNHGGKFSAWSKNFIHGYDEERHAKFKDTHREFMKQQVNPFKYEYWLKEANGDEDLAKELYIKHQTRDLTWFIEKFGPEEGPVRHKAKTEKWIKSFKHTNYSMVSQELFNELAKHIDCTHVYYATYDRPEMETHKNKEFILKLNTTFVRPDFIDLESKKIIEFDGIYWHSVGVLDEDHEAKRDAAIKEAGYKLLHIKEEDYYGSKSWVIKQCLKFLKE